MRVHHLDEWAFPRAQLPGVRIGEAERMDYRLAILPGLLFKAALGVCEADMGLPRYDPGSAGSKTDRTNPSTRNRLRY